MSTYTQDQYIVLPVVLQHPLFFGIWKSPVKILGLPGGFPRTHHQSGMGGSVNM